MPRNPTQNPRMLPPGHRLLEYRIERFLGAGGFGITYLARDERLGHKVAIKEYLPNDLAMRATDNSVVANTTDDEADFQWGLARFLDEARMLAKFNHPNIVRVHRFFEAHGTSYIAMEYVDGEPLSELLKRRGTLTEKEITEHVLPVTAGLTQVHAAGVLHRDIKPGNIIVRPSGVPVLIDFGSARQAISAKSRSVTSVITPGYAPLEQYSTRGSQLPATDIYSLGAVLYRCVAGNAPEDATERALNDELISVAEAVTGTYSADLLTAIDGALRIRSEDRPRDISAFLDLLHGAPKTIDDAPAAGVRPFPGVGRTKNSIKRGTILSLVATGALGCAMVAALLLRPADRGEEIAATESSLGQGTLREPSGESESSDGAQVAESADAALADAYVTARDAYDTGDFTQALREFHALAEQGHSDAQNDLGTMYLKGEGVPEDIAQAVIWYQRSAEHGNARAQYNLGVSHWFGEGVAQDEVQAASLFTMAADQGLSNAQHALGHAYRYGGGVSENDALAIEWYRRAADQGLAIAQYALATMYESGEGTAINGAQAATLYREAAEQELDMALYKLGTAYQYGRLGIPQDDVQAVMWYRKAADQGYARAQYALGRMYRNGEGIPRHFGMAVDLFSEAANQGLADAQFALGLMYSSGDGVTTNNAQAYAWLNLAAARGSSQAEFQLNIVSRRMTDDQVAEAQELSRELDSQIPTLD